MAIFNYIMRKVWLQQTRIGLSLYDATGQGLLTEMVSGKNALYLHETQSVALYFFSINRIWRTTLLS